MKRVVITGAGTINALGHSVPETLEAMREGRCGIGPLEFRDVERLSIQIGGQVRGFGAEGRFNRQQMTLYDRFTQFTLAAAWRKGNRPGFSAAAGPEDGERLYRMFCRDLAALGPGVATGRFGAEMAVHLVNDGPVTIWMDTADTA